MPILNQSETNAFSSATVHTWTASIWAIIKTLPHRVLYCKKSTAADATETWWKLDHLGVVWVSFCNMRVHRCIHSSIADSVIQRHSSPVSARGHSTYMQSNIPVMRWGRTGEVEERRTKEVHIDEAEQTFSEGAPHFRNPTSTLKNVWILSANRILRPFDETLVPTTNSTATLTLVWDLSGSPMTMQKMNSKVEWHLQKQMHRKYGHLLLASQRTTMIGPYSAVHPSCINWWKFYWCR